MDDHPVYTTPKALPSKVDVLPKTFLQLILAAKWLVRHLKVSKTAVMTFAFPSV